jgi:hypothetical protein
VTANDLRIGQGYVRCGRCSNVFNALLKLTEVLGEGEAVAPAPPQADPASTAQIRQALSSAALSAASPPSPPPPPAPTPTSAPTPAPASAAPNAAVAPRAVRPEGLARRSGDALPDKSAPLASARGSVLDSTNAPERRARDADTVGQFEQVLQTLGISLLEDEPARPSAATRPSSPPAALDLRLQAADYDGVENIVMEGDGVTRSDDEDPTGAAGETNDLSAPRADTRRADTRIHAKPDERQVDVIEFDLTDADTAHAPANTAGSDLRVDDDAAVDLDVPSLSASARRWPAILGCTALAVLLLLQALNHWRSVLAASPTWGAPVSHVYAALGVPLRPHWNLGAYDVRQQGAQTDANAEQVIHVRLSLANRAPRAQPTPLLRLTLLDRYGKRIAQRDLTPADYWPKGRAPETFMASDERIDSEVAVRDPSAASASFELDVCLRDVGGTVRCAGDATVPTADADIP